MGDKKHNQLNNLSPWDHRQPKDASTQNIPRDHNHQCQL